MVKVFGCTFKWHYQECSWDKKSFLLFLFSAPHNLTKASFRKGVVWQVIGMYSQCLNGLNGNDWFVLYVINIRETVKERRKLGILSRKEDKVQGL